MTIKEYVEKLDTMEEQERTKQTAGLFYLLSQVSLRTLHNFQIKCLMSNTRFGNTKKVKEDYKEFVKAQNEAIKQCIELETTTVVGRMARVLEGLDLLTLDEEIKLKPEEEKGGDETGSH